MKGSESSIGQSTQTWDTWWKDLTPEKEIQKWDFYGLRPWILKFTPRHGKVLEAGCGLGRWVLLLSRLGIDIEGLDFAKPTIDYLNKWKATRDFDATFVVGDVTELPHENNSLSGYLSFGVIEHFQEGPQKALEEAFRVLRPGGVAIITTPSISWYTPIKHGKKKLKRIIKRLMGRNVPPTEFFQYEYRPKKLASLVNESGLRVTQYIGCDLLYTFFEKGNHKGHNIHKGSFADRFSSKFEKTRLRNYGAQAVTISVKTAPLMHCFFCGELKAKIDSLDKYTVPTCSDCAKKGNSEFYLKGKLASYNYDYVYRTPIAKPQKSKCCISGQVFETDEVFELYGFSKPISPEYLRKKEVNIRLSNTELQPVWRNRTEI